MKAGYIFDVTFVTFGKEPEILGRQRKPWRVYMENKKNLLVILAAFFFGMALTGCSNPFLQLGSDSISQTAPGISGIVASLPGIEDPEDPGEPGAAQSPIVTVNFYIPWDFYWDNLDVTFFGCFYYQELPMDGHIDWEQVYEAYVIIAEEKCPGFLEWVKNRYGHDLLDGYFVNEQLVEAWCATYRFDVYYTPIFGEQQFPGADPEIDLETYCMEIEPGCFGIDLYPKYNEPVVEVWFHDDMGYPHGALINMAPIGYDEFIEKYYDNYDFEYLSTLSYMDVSIEPNTEGTTFFFTFDPFDPDEFINNMLVLMEHNNMSGTIHIHPVPAAPFMP